MSTISPHPPSTSPLSPRHGSDAARVINALVCVWLFISAFAWPHSLAQMTNTWIVAVVGCVIALAAMFADTRLRFANAVLAIWLFISAWALPGGEPATIWNNVIVAIVLFVLSMTAGSGTTTLRHA